MSEAPPAFRARLEDAFGAWTHFVWRRRWLVAGTMLVAAIGLATRIPDLEIKTATEDFLFEGDPVRAAYDDFREQFGQDQIAMVAISPPEIFDVAFLEKLRALHEDLENEVPFLEDVTSLVNVRSVYGRGDELVVQDLLEEMPATPAELAALRDRVLSTPFYEKCGLISADGRSTTILLEVATYSADGADADDLGGFDSGEPTETRRRPFLTGAENSELIETIKRIVARYEAPEFQTLLGGGTMITHEVAAAMARDVPIFFGGALLAIAALLLVLFRRFSPVLLCVMVVVPAVAATFGLAALFRIPFSVTSQLLPSFLLSVGVSYTVHIVTIFLRHLEESGERLAALEHAMRHSGLPILMTAVTTATGMLSFLAAQMKPIVEMGLLAALGALVSLIYALVLLPALLAIFPVRAKKKVETPIIDRVLSAAAGASARHAGMMLSVTAILFIGSLLAMTLLRSSADPVSWFPKDHPFYRATHTIKENFGGTLALEVLIDTKRENGLHDPEVLNRMEALTALVAELRAEGAKLSHTISVADIAKETHQALNANDPEYYSIPQERQLVAQELLLFENGGSDDLEQVVDPQFRVARYTIRSQWMNGVHTAAFIEESEHRFHETLGDAGTLKLTGMSAVISRTIGATMESMLRSYALALMLITPLMILLIGSLRAGLVSMIPNLVPIFMTLGVMGLTGIPIDMFTLLAGCIAIGLAVDDSIHFISSFRRYLAQGNDPIRSVELTMETTGRALLFTSVVLTAGFLVLTLSGMLNLQQVGFLTAFAIASAFVLDITVTPALLVLTHRRRS